VIFFDTETTGLLKPDENELINQPHMIEFYGVRLDYGAKSGDFTFVSEFETYIKPPVPIPPIITKITGIDDAKVADAPTFSQMYNQFCEFFLGETTLVAHNASFDVRILYNELARMEREIQFPWPTNHHCTVELSMPIEHKRLKLKRLHEMAVGHEHSSQHSARGDVEALVTCYKWLMDEGHIL